MSDRNEPAFHTGGGMHRLSRHDGVAVLLLSFTSSPQRCDGRTCGLHLSACPGYFAYPF